MNVTGTVLNILGINGTAFLQQPTDHHWLDRDVIGTDGNGNAIYVAPRQYEMKFDFMDTDTFQQIYGYFQAQGVTGTLTATLPKWNSNPYSFQNYSGCIIREPTYENWFQNWYVGVKLLIVRINNT